MLNFLVKKVHKTGQKAYLSKAWPFYHPHKQIHSWKTLRGSKLEKRKENVNVKVLPSLLGADKISGARWTGLPPTAIPRTSGAVRLGSWAWSAKPKSHTLTTPSRESRTLSNFISRWTTPCWLRKSSASESCLLQSRSISNCQNCKGTWKSDEILWVFSEKKIRTDILIRRKTQRSPTGGSNPGFLWSLVGRSNHGSTKPRQKLLANSRLSPRCQFCSKTKFSDSSCRGLVAQWLERSTCNRKDPGLNPATGLRCVFRLIQLSVLLSFLERRDRIWLGMIPTGASFWTLESIRQYIQCQERNTQPGLTKAWECIKPWKRFSSSKSQDEEESKWTISSEVADQAVEPKNISIQASSSVPMFVSFFYASFKSFWRTKMQCSSPPLTKRKKCNTITSVCRTMVLVNSQENVCL